MSKVVTQTATRFVDLVLSRSEDDWWNNVRDLPSGEVKVLLDIVSAAGFKPKGVVSGTLFNYFQNDTGPTGPLKNFCPFKVIDNDNNGCRLATGWLSCAFYRTLSGFLRRNESRERIIDVMGEEIKRSIPLEPIQLTKEGDFLCENLYALRTVKLEYFIEHVRDENELKFSWSLGSHKFCEGLMWRVRATEDRDAVICRGCNSIRVLFPRRVKTYSDLRQDLLVAVGNE